MSPFSYSLWNYFWCDKEQKADKIWFQTFLFIYVSHVQESIKLFCKFNSHWNFSRRNFSVFRHDTRAIVLFIHAFQVLERGLNLWPADSKVRILSWAKVTQLLCKHLEFLSQNRQWFSAQMFNIFQVQEYLN